MNFLASLGIALVIIGSGIALMTVVDLMWPEKSQDFLERWFSLVQKEKLTAAQMSLENAQVSLASERGRASVAHQRAEYLFGRVAELEAQIDDTAVMGKKRQSNPDGWILSFSCDLRDTHHRFERAATTHGVMGDKQLAFLNKGKADAYKDVSDRLDRYLTYRGHQ